MSTASGKMTLTALLDRFDHLLTAVSPVGFTVLGVASAYYVAFSYGVGVIALTFGKEGVAQVLGSSSNNPVLILVGVPLIPVAFVTLEAMDVEARALLFWRRRVSPSLFSLPLLGRLIEWCWPTPTRKPLPSSQTGMGGSIDYVARSVTAGLLLPFAAYFTGRLLFSFIKNQSRRVVLGGVAYFSLKTLIKMYLRQQEFRRQGFRRVLDYCPQWEEEEEEEAEEDGEDTMDDDEQEVFHA